MMLLQILKIDAMVAISVLALIVSFFSFIIIYNKAVKNSVNKSDVDNVEIKMKTYVDDKDRIQAEKTRAVHHRIDEVKTDNDKAHDQIRKEIDNRVLSMEKKVDVIYEFILKMNK